MGIPEGVNGHCRCWDTTAADLGVRLGEHLSDLGPAQLYRFVRAWHDIDRRYGPHRRAEADAALGAVVRDLVGEDAREKDN